MGQRQQLGQRLQGVQGAPKPSAGAKRRGTQCPELLVIKIIPNSFTREEYSSVNYILRTNDPIQIVRKANTIYTFSSI